MARPATRARRRENRNPRFIVLDGATEAFDSVRWVELLANTFFETHGPTRLSEPANTRMADGGIGRWLAAAQQQWTEQALPFGDVVQS